MLFQQILDFNASLSIDETILPANIHPLYPYSHENKVVQRVTKAFYSKYYNDNNSRTVLMGINPGRLGAGSTGIPFTDTKRLESHCEIPVPEFHTHEPSSVFVYEVIDAYGGPEKFYSDFYFTSVSPIGFVIEKENGKKVNFNYYDQKDVEAAVTPFIHQCMEEQLNWGMDRRNVLCLGSGKNLKFLQSENEKKSWFESVIPIEHPRYVMQYKAKSKIKYIDKYIEILNEIRPM
jgi:hypothetical protein